MKTDVMTIVQHLSRYLQNHPEACDTPEGIARWWWIDADPPPLAVVEAALGWMAACGVIESSRAADGRTRYRRASDAGDLAAKLGAMAADPRSVRPQPDPKRRPPNLH